MFILCLLSAVQVEGVGVCFKLSVISDVWLQGSNIVSLVCDKFTTHLDIGWNNGTIYIVSNRGDEK